MIFNKPDSLVLMRLGRIYFSSSSYSIMAAPPTAELEPLVDGQVSQTDEVMGSDFTMLW